MGQELGLVLRFDAAPAKSFLSGMESELTSILAPTDLRLRWSINRTPNLTGTSLRTVFIRFHGDCAAAGVDTTSGSNGSQALEDGPLMLAETEVSEGTILPFTETDCDRLRTFPRTARRSRGGVLKSASASPWRVYLPTSSITSCCRVRNMQKQGSHELFRHRLLCSDNPCDLKAANSNESAAGLD